MEQDLNTTCDYLNVDQRKERIELLPHAYGNMVLVHILAQHCTIQLPHVITLFQSGNLYYIFDPFCENDPKVAQTTVEIGLSVLFLTNI